MWECGIGNDRRARKVPLPAPTSWYRISGLAHSGVPRSMYKVDSGTSGPFCEEAGFGRYFISG
jgi:hypothetical protein